MIRFSRQLVTRVAGALLQAVTFVLLARELGPEAFGLFAAMLAVGNFSGRFFGLGLSTRALRVAAERSVATAAGSFVVLQLATVPLVIALLGIAQVVLGSRGANFEMFLAAASLVLLDYLSGLHINLLLGQFAYARAEMLLILRRIFPAMGLLLGASHNAALSGLAVGAALAVCMSYGILAAYISRPSDLRNRVRESLPYWSSTVLAGVNGLDVFLLVEFASPKLLGWYGTSVRMISPLTIVSQSAMSLLTPHLSKSGDALRSDTFRKARLLSFALAASVAAVSPAVGWLAVHVLGPEYREAWPLFVAVTTTAGVLAVTEVYSSMMYAEGRAGLITKARIISTPMHFLLVCLGASMGPLALSVAVVLSAIFEATALHVMRGGDAQTD